MGTADFMLFALLTLANACVLGFFHRRRDRRGREQRMMRSLRNAIRRETALPTPDVTGELVAA
jgi:hypothetical protein